KILDDSGSTYEYQSGKGVKISYISEECKTIFCKKIIKFFISRDFNIKKNSLHSEFLSQYNLLDVLDKIHFILKSTKISSTNFIISFLCSLVILDKNLGGFNLNNSNLNLNEYPDIKNLIDETMPEYPETYRNHLLFFVVSLKKQHFLFEPEISSIGNTLLSKLKEKFNLKDLNLGLENILLRKICISFFKYDNNILKVKNTPIDKSDKNILSAFDEVLNSINRSLFFFDKISIINILKRIIIEHNKSLVQNVLLLFNEVTISDDHYLRNNLKLKAPNINFEIEPGFLYRTNVTLYNEKYDLILSDESYTYQNIKLLNSYNALNVLNLIDSHILEIALNPLNL
ncbi:MAG: hypothetical protein ACRC5W_09420, partial [Cetobacterium sp.]